MNVFFGYHFPDNGESNELPTMLKRVIESHTGKRPFTGENLYGEDISDAIKKRIKKADAVVVLVKGTWTRTELLSGQLAKKHSIGIVDSNEPIEGLNFGHENIQLDENDSTKAILKLSETLGGWKRQLDFRRKICYWTLCTVLGGLLFWAGSLRAQSSSLPLCKIEFPVGVTAVPVKPQVDGVKSVTRIQNNVLLIELEQNQSVAEVKFEWMRGIETGEKSFTLYKNKLITVQEKELADVE